MCGYAQEPVVRFDFNNQQLAEVKGRSNITHGAISLTTDRFGNKKSAIHTNGHPTSYLSLGTGNNLKPKTGTFSLWVKLNRYVYLGRGYECNPILSVRNSAEVDFNNAITLAFDRPTNKLCVNTSKDSTEAAIVTTSNEFQFQSWYHIVVTVDAGSICLYLDGEFQGCAQKSFETIYWPTDSVVIGNSACLKNFRFADGDFDDIAIYDRVLSTSEILELYNAPNPNKTRLLLYEIVKYGGIVMTVFILILLVLRQQKQRFKKRQAELELQNRINELEIKAVKSQMNPHFMSNCLSAIQLLIYEGEIEKAVQYIAKFSYFLRQVLTYSDQQFITIAEEIELIKLNVNLEQLRFKNGFGFSIEAEDLDKFSDVLVPSIITQPFIENAIWHGLSPVASERYPVLKIRIYAQDEYLFIEIEDNGAGRKKKKEKIIQGRVSRGTRLITEKMELLNKTVKNNPYQFHIIDLFDKQLNGCGTNVKIRLANTTED
ncbi:MAG: LamG-like jellyroll fold domain-containing protein [Bacteroidia bacterium]